MSLDLDTFCKAMDGEWIVVRYEIVAENQLRIHYKSLLVEGVEWSHVPTSSFETVPTVGTVGRISFQWKKQHYA